jgi:hypothetical protein
LRRTPGDRNPVFFRETSISTDFKGILFVVVTPVVVVGFCRKKKKSIIGPLELEIAGLIEQNKKYKEKRFFVSFDYVFCYKKAVVFFTKAKFPFRCGSVVNFVL